MNDHLNSTLTTLQITSIYIVSITHTRSILWTVIIIIIVTIIIIISTVTAFAGFIFEHQSEVGTIQLGHHSFKSFILLMHSAPSGGFEQIPDG